MAIEWVVIVLSFAYLTLLFFIAGWAEKNAHKKLFSSPYIYALSLAVFCTAWTYYGSVGRAANQGLDFLTTYVGPILMAPLYMVVSRKIIRICKVQRITTIADFISARYGKSLFLGAFITIICVLAIIPYMSIQLKAISYSFSIFSEELPPRGDTFFKDTAFYVTMVLGIFTILFGTRKIDATQKNTGLITAIAFESLFKLFAFLLLGIYVTYGLFDGFGDVFSSAKRLTDFERLITIDPEHGYSNWFWLNLLSMLAIILLPRQFHVTVKENTNEEQLKKVVWLFPLYLLLINLFVIPIALGGRLLFEGQGVDADTYVLAMPLANDSVALALLVYLGGFSAATSMIIVSTSALSIMLSNNLLVPMVLRNHFLGKSFEGRLNSVVLRGRQVMIVVMLILAYLYFKLVGERFSLVSIGLISFVGVAQFAPAGLGGLFWKRGNYKGALTGLIIGFVVWFFTLILPTMVTADILPSNLLNEGFLGLSYLRPNYFMGLNTGNFVAQGFMWSILLNTLAYVAVSAITRQSTQETNQSEVFVDIFKYSTVYESAILWKGKAFVADIRDLLATFLGPERTDRAFRKFKARNDIEADSIEADSRVVNYAEKLLAGAVGSASARVLMSSVVKEEKINMHEVFDMLQETQHYISDNKELKRKSEELQEASLKLQQANDELTKLDRLKDEFISTVTHEMRTPITSIRAFSEILNDNDDLEAEQHGQFLKTIIDETERMERLINQVLDLEKMESGQIQLTLRDLRLNDVTRDALNSMQHLLKEKQIKLVTQLHAKLPMIKGDRDRLMQVILNLVSNAMKFCDPKSGEIRIVTGTNNGSVELSVLDNGPGVPVESQSLVFEAFYQAENQTLKKPEGTGLGLTICQKIINMHDGKIWVKNGIKKGAVVTFSIPRI
ncbi:histidine kinase [Fulvivirga sp. M361]|uniref:ATP-binding protein n=1 Tax=Fulvivirga sp. M361 TaxID=2594266 RepID=UPI001179D26C|nr:sensor histidine kinase [Fulvivirga sp. M361]TRX50884.1 histidine kinase [Fulvivirga sp. M361]